MSQKTEACVSGLTLSINLTTDGGGDGKINVSKMIFRGEHDFGSCFSVIVSSPFSHALYRYKDDRNSISEDECHAYKDLQNLIYS